MYKIELTTWERVSLFNLLEAQEGDLRTLKKMFALADVLEMNDEEKEAVGYEFDGRALKWDDPDKVWTIELKGPEAKLLTKTALSFKQWRGRAALPMLEKLEVLSEEIVD